MFVNNCPEQNSISSKIKGLYEPTRESNEGLVLICLKCNILQDVCVGGGGGLQSVKGSCVLRRF